MGAYEEMLARRAIGARVSMSGGSGYFAQRGSSLDPSLFDGDRLRPEVRRTVLSLLYRFWDRKYPHAQLWSKLWIAGSGITTAWNASREANGAPGDLDCLIGVDYEQLRAAVPAFSGSSDQAIAHYLNQEMHDQLWPSTDHYRIGSGVYEVTFYVNDGVGIGKDALLAINPYAAYNVSDDEWTLHPVEVPKDFGDHYFSEQDRALAAADASFASSTLEKFGQLQVQMARADQPHRVNLLREMHSVVRDGAARFDNIHHGRRAAFGPGGQGYFDPANYRWQAGKGSGAITVLRALKQLDEAAHRDVAQKCSDPEHLLVIAALSNGGR